MTQRRLRWLLVVMGILLVVRLLVPNRPVEVDLAQAVARPTQPRLVEPVAMPAPQPVAAPDMAAVERDALGNAFAVRLQVASVVDPAPPPEVPQTPQIAAVAEPPPPVVETPPPPVAPPPPFKVIGTWDDGVAPGVFVATPIGTQLARIGVVLLTEYRVTAITGEQLTLEHVTTKQAHQLAVPRGAGP